MSGLKPSVVAVALLAAGLAPAAAQSRDVSGEWEFRQQGEQSARIRIIQTGDRLEGRLIEAVPAFGFAADEVVLRGMLDRGRIVSLEKLVKPAGGACPELAGWRPVTNPRLDPGNPELDAVAGRITGRWAPGVFLLDGCLSLPAERDFLLARVSGEPAADVLAVRFLDHRHQDVVGASLMIGEVLHVEVEFARPLERARQVELSWGEGRKAAVELRAGRAEPERSFYVSDRVIFEPRGTGGALTAAPGDVVTARIDGHAATLRMDAAAVTLRVVTRGAWDEGAAVSSITSYEPFQVEVAIPRDQAQRVGDTVTVNLSSALADDDEDLVLESLGNVRGPVRYANRQPVTLAKGAAWAHIVIFPLWTMKPVDTENGDTLTIRYGGAQTQVTVYDHSVQQAIAMYRRGFEALRGFLGSALQEPGLSKEARELVLTKLELTKNALAVIAHDRSRDDLWSDYKCLRIVEEYAGLVEADPRGWTRVPEAERVYARFGIAVRSREELDAIQRGFDRARGDHSAALYQGVWAVGEGVYQVVTNVTLANQLHTAIFGIDNMGRRVDVTHRILAGVEAGSLAVLFVAHLGARPGELTPPARGIDAFSMRTRPTRIRRPGTGGEEFLLEVYGGASQVRFPTARGVREFDSFSKMGRVGRESKVGPTSLTKRDVVPEIAKDAELLASGQVARIEWHFFANEAGEFGITGPLRAELQRVGIVIVERPDLRMR